MTRSALIVVDVQNDFLPGGPLAVPKSDEILPVIDKLIREGDFDVIVHTRDMHPEDHCSFSDDPKFEHGSWPKHCVAGTEGAGIHPDAAIGLHTRPEVFAFSIAKGTNRDREEYSGFEGHVDGVSPSTELMGKSPVKLNSNLEAALRALEVEKVTIVGLALDYCVYRTAHDAVDSGFDTTVRLDATRPVNEEAPAIINEVFAAIGVHLVDSGSVISDDHGEHSGSGTDHARSNSVAESGKSDTKA
jgi:nicotinamidase/pyrazinamidase